MRRINIRLSSRPGWNTSAHMKNILAATLCLLALPTLAFAQTDEETPASGSSSLELYSDRTPAPAARGATLQLKGGPGFATMSTSQTTGTEAIKSTTGLFIAAEFDIPVNEGFSFLTGINYVQKGYRAQASGSDPTLGAMSIDMTGKIGYLEIPALAKLNFGDTTRFSFMAGPYFAIRVASSAKGSISIGGQTQTINESSDDNGLSRTDFGFRAGAGVEFPMSQDLGFVIGAAYDLGLSNVASSSSTAIHNRALLANAGLAISI